MKDDEKRIYWLNRYLEVLDKSSEVLEKGEALFEQVKELDALGASADEIATVIDQTIKLVTDFRKEETTCINELMRLGDIPNIEKMRSGFEDRSAKIDTFLIQAILFKESQRGRGT